MSTPQEVQRAKYVQLMDEIETLEDTIDKKPANILELQAKLATLKNELARVSDGCGTPHTHIC